MQGERIGKSAVNWNLLYFIIIGQLFLTGCGAGKTLVLTPPPTSLHISSVGIVEGESTVKVPQEVKEKFHDKLERLLYEDGAFQKGSDLRLRYRFIQFNPGNQFVRWFCGGIGNAGEGSLTVEVKYFGPTETELATIQSEGKIGSGFFGGPFELAVGKTAAQIAEYTRQNFR